MDELKWFEEMSWTDWEIFAENLKCSTSTTPHSNSSCDRHSLSISDQYSNFCQMATQDASSSSMAQLENALQPLKRDLIGSCIMFSNRIESLANFSEETRSGLSKTLSNQAVLMQVAGQVEMTIPSVIKVMGLAYLWLADSLDEEIVAKTQHSNLYSHVTGRSLVCVLNSSCVVHTVASTCTRLTDSSRGCLILSKAHKKIDTSMKFLARTLYSVVHGQKGEEWFDLRLGHSVVFNTKKNEARKLIRTHVMQNSVKDSQSLAALEAADDAWRREKECAKLSRSNGMPPAAGENAGVSSAAGGVESGCPNDELEGTSPEYAGLEDRPPTQAPTASAAAATAAAAAAAVVAAAAAPQQLSPSDEGAAADAAAAPLQGEEQPRAAPAPAPPAGPPPPPAPAAPPAPPPAAADGGAQAPLQGAGPAPAPAGRPQRGQAGWAAAHEPREPPTGRHADFAEWVKQLATAVFSAFSALPKTGKLNQVPRACAQGGACRV